ncbi:MAG: hypothetical protein FJ291_13700 [Planctomycetes bacterium]|nr:hypothetical protein [Planctomycetota bacterium]
MSATAAHVDALDFLRTLHEGGEGYIEFRFKRNGRMEQAFRRLPLDTLPPLPTDGDCYFGACPRAREAGDATAVDVATCLWADVDFHKLPGGEQGAAERRTALGGLAPSIIVATGHGEHWYWPLREPAPAPDACAVVELLRAAICPKLDKVSDPPRVLRIPGTFNVKGGAKLPVRVVHWQPERRFNLSDFDALGDGRGEPAGDYEARERAAIQGEAESSGATIPEGERNAALTREAGRLRRLGYDAPIIRAALLAFNRERCRPPLPDREVESIARSIGQKPARG